MKHIKTLGLTVASTVALMAFAVSPASGTALYNGSTHLGTGSVIDFSIPAGGSAVLKDTSGNELEKCSTSTVKGEVTNAGGATATVRVNVVDWSFSICSFQFSTILKGAFEVHQIGAGTEGTVTALAEIGFTINTVLFGTCSYVFKPGVDLGVLKTASSGAATFNMNAVATKSSGGIACPETGKWAATYTGTDPTNLRVESS